MVLYDTRCNKNKNVSRWVIPGGVLTFLRFRFLYRGSHMFVLCSQMYTNLNALDVLLVIRNPGRIVIILVSFGQMFDSLECRNIKYFFFLSVFLQTTKPVVPAHSKLTSLDQLDSYTRIQTVCFPCRLYEKSSSSSLMLSWLLEADPWKMKE